MTVARIYLRLPRGSRSGCDASPPLAPRSSLALLLLLPLACPALARDLDIATTSPAGYDPSAMADIDASKLPADKQYPTHNMIKRYRPWVVDDHKGSLLVENMRIHDVTNQKAIDIDLCSFDRPSPAEGQPLTYAKVIVRNCEIFNINRDAAGARAGLHIDFLRICGGGDRQPFDADVLVEDVYLHDGNALPLLIQEGKFSTITLRRVRMENTAIGSVQIGVINQGHIRNVIIEDCPGVRVALMGRPGSIERCTIRNSPGAFIRDTRTNHGISGTLILAEHQQAPERE
jgi:hypothetical protein